MKRSFDLIVSLVAVITLSIPLMLISILVKITSKGPILYWSERVGYANNIFHMPKFRTMYIGTPVVATHLLSEPKVYITKLGAFLRRTSLDELPQLLCVIRGDMSLVGPRPALFNQLDLIALRTNHGVHMMLPGITGWAQVNGRDELCIEKKVARDAEYLLKKSFGFDLKIMLLTVGKVFRQDGVAH